MLQIDLDILDAAITVPALSVMDPVISFAQSLQQFGQTSFYMLAPANNALMIRPYQLTPYWYEQVKFRAGDYNSPAGWEEQQVRAVGDYWMHSWTTPTALSLAYTFPANTGWFFEFRAYALPKSLPGAIFDCSFGQWFQIVVHSDGRTDLYDNRVSATQPVGTGNIARGKQFINSDVSLLILPYKRTRLLVWSPGLGGFFDAEVGTDSNSNITAPCAPTVYSSSAPPSALVTISPLLFDADGTAALNAPAKSLEHALVANPTFTGSVFDDHTTAGGAASLAQTKCQLTAVTPYVAGHTITSFVYSVQLTGNAGHQTAEGQGVSGIGPSTATSSGDSVFGGATYPYSLFTPFLYTTVFGYPRQLGAKQYTTNVMTGILSASMVLSDDRSAKSFTFTVDDPNDIYTSIKDLQNRRCRAYLTTASVESGSIETVIAADPDPDTPLIVANGNKRVYLFDGFMDQVHFIDGIQSQIEIPCQGIRKRLKNYKFDGHTSYDNWSHTAAVADIFQRAGFVGSTDTETTGMGLEVITGTDNTLLTQATPGDLSIWTPAQGATAEEFLDTICNFSGWIYDDLLLAGATNSCWYYVPTTYFTDIMYATEGTQTVYMGSQYTAGLSNGPFPLPDSTRPNMGSISALGKEDAPTQDTIELIANRVVVIGRDDQGNILIAQAQDTASINDRTAVNYVGEVRLLILVSDSINTQACCNQVCANIFQSAHQATVTVQFANMDYIPALAIQSPVTLQNYWNGTITGITADFSRLNYRKTKYLVKRALTG